MSDPVVQLVLRARDEATAKIREVSGAVAELLGIMSGLTAGLGPIGAVATAVAAAGAAAIAMGRKYADAGLEIQHASEATGVSAERYQVLRKVVEESGGNAEGLEKALERLNRSIEAGDPLLKALHITTRDVGEAFIQLMQRLDDSSDSAAKTTAAVKLLGKTGADLVGSSHAIATQTEETEAQLRKSGDLMSGEAVTSAVKLHEEFDKLGHSVGGLGKWIGDLSANVLLPLIANLNRAIDAARDLGPRLNLSGLGFRFVPGMGAGVGAGVTTPYAAAGGAAGSTASVDLQHALDSVAKKSGDEEKARAKRIEEMNKLLGQGKDLAIEFSDAMDRVEQGRKLLTTMKDLQEAGVLDRFVPVGLKSQLSTQTDETPRRGLHYGPDPAAGKYTDLILTDPSKFDFDAYNKKLHESLETMSKISPQMAFMKAAWKDLAHNLKTDSESLAHSGLMDVVRAWDLGTKGAADRIRQTFRQLFADIANAAVDEGLGYLLGAIGFAIGGPVGGFIGTVGGEIAGHGSGGHGPGWGGGAPSAPNVIIHTYDTHSMYQSLQTGDLGKAMRRQAIMRRAGAN